MKILTFKGGGDGENEAPIFIDCFKKRTRLDNNNEDFKIMLALFVTVNHVISW